MFRHRTSAGFTWCLPTCSINGLALQIANERCRKLTQTELLEDPELRDFAQSSNQSTSTNAYEVSQQGSLELSHFICQNMFRSGISSSISHSQNAMVIARRHPAPAGLIHALCFATTVETVVLWRCDVNDASIQALCKALANGSCRIAVLRLPRNYITATGARHLAAGLSGRSHLHTLDLSDNVVGNEGCRHLAEALSQARSLRILSLRSNGIGATGAIELAAALAGGPSADRRCGRASHPPPRLEELLLQYNAVGDRGAAALAAALESNSFLRVLHLARAGISPAGAGRLAAALRRNSALEVLVVQAAGGAGGGGAFPPEGGGSAWGELLHEEDVCRAWPEATRSECARLAQHLPSSLSLSLSLCLSLSELQPIVARICPP